MCVHSVNEHQKCVPNLSTRLASYFSKAAGTLLFFQIFIVVIIIVIRGPRSKATETRLFLFRFLSFLFLLLLLLGVQAVKP